MLNFDVYAPDFMVFLTPGLSDVIGQVKGDGKVSVNKETAKRLLDQKPVYVVLIAYG